MAGGKIGYLCLTSRAKAGLQGEAVEGRHRSVAAHWVRASGENDLESPISLHNVFILCSVTCQGEIDLSRHYQQSCQSFKDMIIN